MFDESMLLGAWGRQTNFAFRTVTELQSGGAARLRVYVTLPIVGRLFEWTLGSASGVEGRWSLAENRLILEFPRRTVAFKIDHVDARTLEVTNPRGGREAFTKLGSEETA